jgi:regulator of RNase E activity RraB
MIIPNENSIICYKSKPLLYKALNTMQLIDERVELDKVTLNKLKQAGDDDQLVRLIDHSFTADSKEALEKLADCLIKMDFSNIKLFQPEDEHYYLLECTSIDCTEFHNVSKTSVLMTILSEHFSVSYDGWGSMVANEIQ